MKKEQLSEVIRVRVSPQEYKKINAAAEAENRTVSDYIRLVLAGKVERP